MKKIKFGSVEILGYFGIFLWAAVILLREYPLWANETYRFWLGIVPNLAAAWVATMFGKWAVLFLFKKDITVKIHLLLCVGVVLLALASEIFHDLFLHSPFDVYDMLITLVAQGIMFFLPLLTNDKYFKGYHT